MKTRLVMMVVAVAVGGSACGQLRRMTQSVDRNRVRMFNTVACSSGTTSWLRSYSLAAQGISQTIDVTGVRHGVETAVSTTGSQTVMMNVYADTAPVPGVIPPYAALVPLVSEVATIVDQSLSFNNYTFCNPVRFAVTGANLVVELAAPATATASFFIGSNDGGQTAPSFLATPACGAPNPFDATPSWPLMHLLLEVNYYLAPGPPGSCNPIPYPGTQEDLVMLTGVSGPTSGGPGLFVKPVAAGDFVQVDAVSPQSTFVGSLVAILAEVFMTGAPPAPPFPGIAVSGLPGSVHVVYGGGQVPPFGATPLLPAGGVRVAFIYPPALAGIGLSMLLQAFCPSPLAANGIFASTNGYELQG